VVVIRAGADAPPIDGVDLEGGPRALWFHKVTCPVCQLAAPVAERLGAAYPERLVGLGQDPEDQLRQFQSAYGTRFEVISDAPAYGVSGRYGLAVVPTLVLVDRGTVLDVVESWDRDGYNRVSARLAELIGVEPSVVSTVEDGLPSFRPG
jgi:thiol-disulfide isomerase/thioredoxin